MITTKYIGITNIYGNCYNGNIGNKFYIQGTFGGDIYSDPCKIVTNSQFRNYVSQKIDCSGAWCYGSTYKCTDRGNVDCYHVEHIIDYNGPEFESTIYKKYKNIAGNRIMIWGRWNKALGGLSRNNYYNSKREKINVYGNNIVNDAYINILNCIANDYPNSSLLVQNDLHNFTMNTNINDNNNSTYDEECDESYNCSCDSDYECGCDYNLDLNSDNYLFYTIINIIITSFSVLLIIICGICIFCGKNRGGYTQIN